MFRMTVADVFAIKGRGLVATGRVEEGAIRVGDVVTANGRDLTVDAIEAFRKKKDEATVGENIGLLFRELVSRDDLKSGDLITGSGTSFPSPPGDPSWEKDFPGGLPR